MKKLPLSLIAFAAVGLSAASAYAEHITTVPDGVETFEHGIIQSEGDCEIIRYDDGTDDQPSSGSTLGGPSAPYQYLGIIATAPADQSYEVTGAGFFSEFWVTAGNVNITIAEVGNEANTTTGAIAVNNGGDWELLFDTPICVGAGADFSVMLCPDPNVWGVSGEDLAAPDGRSYFTSSPDGCTPVNQVTSLDYMIWACVSPCGASPTIESSWGEVKAVYR